MAAREEDKAMAGLLRRSLAQDAGSRLGEDCPGPEILAAYFDRALDAEETGRYDLHFSRCAACREQLAAMARAGAATIAEDAEKKAAGAWGWLAGPRWLMPAAAMVVTLLVIGGIALRLRKPVGPANEIAMVRPEPLPSPNSAPPSSAPAARPELSVNSKPSPEAAPPPKVASPGTREALVGRPAAPNPRDASSSAMELSGSQTFHARGATSSAGAKAGVSHTNTAARRDELSHGAARANSSAAQATPQPQMMPRLNSPVMDRGALQAGSGAGVGTINSAAASADAAANGLAQGKTLAPAAPPAKKAEEESVESDLSAAVQTGEAKEASAAKTKLPETAVASRSVTAMNLTASKATEAAALARLREAQISSNLMNLHIQTPDAKILWMIAGPGEIERSEDGGASWKTEYLDTHALIVAGAAPTGKICWLAGANGTILRTTNGSHWKTISPPEQTDFVRVEATDALTATVTAMDGRKFMTSDGGKSWSSVK